MALMAFGQIYNREKKIYEPKYSEACSRYDNVCNCCGAVAYHQEINPLDTFYPGIVIGEGKIGEPGTLGEDHFVYHVETKNGPLTISIQPDWGDHDSNDDDDDDDEDEDEDIL